MNLQSYHTFGVPCFCRSLHQLNDLSDIETLLDEAPPFVIGSGSNILPIAPITRSLLINQLRGIQINESAEYYEVTAAAGESWHGLVSTTLNQGIGGLENLALIPGTVGAAPIQNIGAYGVEQSAYCKAVEVFEWDSGRHYWLSAADCKFAYRDSIFKAEPERWLITAVNYALPKQWVPKLHYAPLNRLSEHPTLDASVIAAEVIATRQLKLPDPNVMGNAGSFFKNPSVTNALRAALCQQYPNLVWFADGETHSKLAAGWLIDSLGLKGKRVGDAAVHIQQALVLVNRGAASGADVVRLAGLVRDAVYQQYGLLLEPEVQLLAGSNRVNLDSALELVNAG